MFRGEKNKWLLTLKVRGGGGGEVADVADVVAVAVGQLLDLVVSDLLQ